MGAVKDRTNEVQNKTVTDRNAIIIKPLDKTIQCDLKHDIK